jgi:hypothetical protein
VTEKTRIINIKKRPDLVRDPNYVYIGRGSIYGNPFSHIDMSTALVRVGTKKEAIENNRKWLNGEIKLEIEPPTLEEIMALDGKILGCFCVDVNGNGTCHGDNYVDIINREKKKGTIVFKEKDLF